ncbi:hypothetical protein [Haladaptatus cibarius]|uniref:hypothetical protein n=1 Tax=Haladaptatus cibarius TaxID=453847 RepID=UPI000678E493|nr:hypothetical protein [Haladaptatus cibarius]
MTDIDTPNINRKLDKIAKLLALLVLFEFLKMAEKLLTITADGGIFLILLIIVVFVLLVGILAIMTS